MPVVARGSYHRRYQVTHKVLPLSIALTSAQAARASEAHRLLGAGNSVGALTIAKALAAEAPRAPDAQQLLAICLGQGGDSVGAEAAFRRALELAPGQPAILSNYALFLRKQNRRNEALACLQQIVKLAPRHAPAWIDLGLTALALGQLPLAQSALQKAVELQPDSSRAWHGLGNTLRAVNELAAAENAYRRSLALTAGNAGGWASLGGVLRLLGRPAEARECYARARQYGMQGPDLEDAEIGALLDDARLDEAVEKARTLTERHPDYVPGLITRSNIEWEYGERQDSGADPLAHFRASADARPDDDALQFAFISFLLEAKRCDEALDRLIALRQRADSPLLMTLQANALEVLGRVGEAGALYAQAHRSFGSSNPSFLNAYVRHLLKAGRWDEAARLSQDAVRTDTDNQESWAYLATAWRLLDDPREHWLCDYDNLVTLLEVEPPAGHTDMASFLAELEQTLDALHKARTEPVRQSLRGGSQTSGRLFGRPQRAIIDIEQALLRSIERRIAALPADPTHPYLRRKQRSVSFSGSWSVKLWSSGSHVNHFHSEGWMSSAFYVSLPPAVRAAESSTTHAGHIQFGQPPVELGLELPPRRIIQPRVGHLALFPSYLWHGTVPFVDDAPRLTIAFDMLPKA